MTIMYRLCLKVFEAVHIRIGEFEMIAAIENPEILAALVPIVAIGGYFWYAAVKKRSDNELKRSMVERGMSADEIERILNAGEGKRSKK